MGYKMDDVVIRLLSTSKRIFLAGGKHEKGIRITSHIKYAQKFSSMQEAREWLDVMIENKTFFHDVAPRIVIERGEYDWRQVEIEEYLEGGLW